MDTTRTMITFKNSGFKFTYRIGGIALHNGKVLFQKATVNPEAIFWFLPGGRAELGESSEETLKREMREEMGVEITIERPVYIVENFFGDEAKYHHELGVYFLMTFPPDSYLYHEQGPFIHEENDELPLIFEWLPLDQLEQLPVQPKFFRSALQTIPVQLTHVVQIDAPVDART